MCKTLNHNSVRNWVHQACGDVHRIEAFFSGVAYAPHRHDTYTIGITLEGVQSFDYRGETRHSLPGGMVVLHPDELHDGRAGTDAGFKYRTIYIEPSQIQSSLGRKPLPFIEGGVSSDPRLLAALLPLLEEYDQPLEALEYQDALYDLATALDETGNDEPTIKLFNYNAAQLARQYIHERLEHGISLDDLEAITGHDKWQLSRDFRALFGTSPHRYLTMRRLDKARKMMRAGHSIADAAFASAFSDQSHFTRHFKKTYGMTPKMWMTALGGPSVIRKSGKRFSGSITRQGRNHTVAH